jgi:HAMP domain-containing protein
MTLEGYLLIFFGVIILVLLFLIELMQRRVEQLLDEVDQLRGRMNVTSTEIEALTKNVEEFKKLKI